LCCGRERLIKIKKQKRKYGSKPSAVSKGIEGAVSQSFACPKEFDALWFVCSYLASRINSLEINVPDTLKEVALIRKDTKRFPNTRGWAYAEFGYTPASNTLVPDSNEARGGYACHTTVAVQD
jgi:hypothetical protein